MTKAMCPVCHSHCEKSFSKPPGVYYSCDKCQSMFLWPMPTVEQMQQYANDQYRDGHYADYVKAKDLKTYTFQGRITEILKYLSPNSATKLRHLDVGCSVGFMIEVALQNGFDSFGVEFSQEAIAKASPDIQKRIMKADVNQLSASDDEKFDLITCFDIVEHVQEANHFLSSLRKLLRPGGVLVLTTPDPEHRLARIMGRRWPMLQPLQHSILFSKKGLSSVLKETGFHELASVPAYKVLSFDYLSGQLKDLNPVLSKVMTMVSRAIPRSLSKKPIRINISEFMSISRLK